jgi:hypothetical protein
MNENGNGPDMSMRKKLLGTAAQAPMVAPAKPLASELVWGVEGVPQSRPFVQGALCARGPRLVGQTGGLAED